MMIGKSMMRRGIPSPKILNLHRGHSTTAHEYDGVGIGIFSGICFGAAGLGIWQMQRYQWKTDLVLESRKQLSDKPFSLPQCSSQHNTFETLKQHKNMRVKITGTFMHDKEVLLGPRTGEIACCLCVIDAILWCL